MGVLHRVNSSYNLQLILGDTREELKSLPDKVIQSCITSPPYWGTRDYGIGKQIGAEDVYEQYISHLKEVFMQVHRVLKDDGTLWLNIGDTYTSGDRGWRAPDRKNPARTMKYRPPTPNGLKPKDLVGIPWRVAFALQQAGWYLRSDIIWYKPNAQPESVKDRPTRAHEYLFLFSKSEHYYYDYESSLEPSNGGHSKRNRRSVWSIVTEARHPPHLAVFPPQLVRLCVLSSTKFDDTILDPFMGSGTVGLVCKETKRKFIGIELKPEYIDIALKRLGDVNANEEKKRCVSANKT
ncbi:MAG: site-specific DNA-methyltransferase [Dehalococcoidales bacterium]|jgi:DNA modification methylase